MHKLLLNDGRLLSYRLAGQGKAKAAATVIYHHGWPSSSAESAAWHEPALQQGIQLVAVDRPGINASTFNPTGA